MSLDYGDTVEAITEGVRAALVPHDDDDPDPVIATVPVTPFDAVDIDDKPQRVVAIVIRKSGVADFLTMYQDMDDGGAIYAGVAEGIWPTTGGIPFPRPCGGAPETPFP